MPRRRTRTRIANDWFGSSADRSKPVDQNKGLTVNAPQPAVVDKVRKLLALASGNQNEHERDRAMEAAMELLARHNLTLSQITPADAAKCVQAVRAKFNLDVWARIVLSAACELYYTTFYVQHDAHYDPYYGFREVKYPMLVGTEENIAVTIEMCIWLLDSIRKESNRMYKNDKFRRSFRLGAADKLAERAHAIIEAEKAAALAAGPRDAHDSAANGLILLRTQLERANDEYLKSLNLQYRKPRSVTFYEEAYENGEAFGEQMRLQRRAPAEPKIAGLITQR